MDKRKTDKNKNTKHCHGGLGGVCNDDLANSQSVIQNIANDQGAPSVNPTE